MFNLRILSAIREYERLNPVRLHMPGHKGRGKAKGLFPAKYDVTELNKIANEKVLSEAEKDVAEILKAKHCRFLSDGASAGIFAAVRAVKDKGSKMIINRTAHKSVFNALEIFGIEPVAIDAENWYENPEFKAEAAIGALLEDESVIGAFFTYPDYYGRTFDIENVQKAVKKRNKLLLIDNAHGGHFRFSERLIYAGDFADVTVDGLHKTFYTLNQGAIISVNNAELIDKADAATNAFATTSPSYPILASVEYGEKFAETFGRKIIDEISERKARLKQELEIFGAEVMPSTDPFKIAVDFKSLNISPYSAEKILEKEGIFCEMNDGRRLLFMFSFASVKRDFRKLAKALKKVFSDKTPKDAYEETELPKIIGKRILSYSDAMNGEKEYTPLSLAEGKIAAASAGVFPPCYPLILAGERIEKPVINALLKAPNVFGIKEGGILTVKE